MANKTEQQKVREMFDMIRSSESKNVKNQIYNDKQMAERIKTYILKCVKEEMGE